MPTRRRGGPGSYGHTTTPTGGGVKPGKAVTPIGRKARKVTRTAEALSASTGAPARAMPGLGAAKKEVGRLSNVQSALSRVKKAYSSGPRVGKTYDPNEAASLVRSVGGTKPEARALSTKIVGESGGNPKAVGHDPGGTTGLGLWQLTTGVGNDDLINKHGGPKAMLKPKPNAKAALELYRGGGLSNWYAPSNPPGNPSKVKPKVKPRPKDLKTIQRAGVAPPRPTKGATAPRPSVKQAAAKAGVKLTPEQTKKLKAIKGAANKSAGTPYVWGGGHGQFTDPVTGLDCSGAVSRVLHAAGVTDRPLTSGEIGSVVKPGPGAVSVYYNDGHTFMKIGNKWWGTSVGDSGSGGLGPHPAPSASYLSQFAVGHVPGLGKKAAAARGIKLTGAGSTAGGFSSSDLKSYASATGMSVQGAKAVAKKNPELIKRKLAKIRASYSETSSGDTTTLTRSSRRKGAPVV